MGPWDFGEPNTGADAPTRNRNGRFWSWLDGNEEFVSGTILDVVSLFTGGRRTVAPPSPSNTPPQADDRGPNILLIAIVGIVVLAVLIFLLKKK